jgi:hypothetical protein
MEQWVAKSERFATDAISKQTNPDDATKTP